MTREQLEQIKARHAATPEGKFVVAEEDEYSVITIVTSYGELYGEFLKHARTHDIPALVAEVEELWRMLKKIQDIALKACAYMEDIEDDPKESWIGEFAARARALVERISDDIDEHEGGFK